ncbi:hypothetical protein ABBQ32_001001 [Trebouxia sp. C0010 RCD-2024]
MITRGCRVPLPSRGPSDAHTTPKALYHVAHCSVVSKSRTTTTKNWRRGSVANSLESGLQESLARVAAVSLAVVLACTSPPCSAASVLGRSPTFSADYAAVVRKREGRSKSNLPSSREAEALLEINEDLFTTEALEGMSRIVHYAKFVEGLKDPEEAPGCEHCTDNRLLLEHAWQVVANEFYDPAGRFSQAKWADQLLRTFKGAPGGVLRNRHETYKAAEEMMASLGDRYSQFLPPSQYRRAIRHPQPAEREYLAAQSTGTGVHVGGHVEGGWLVDAAMAESPAEEAGIVRGDCIIEINGYPVDGLNAHEVSELQRGPLGSTVALTIAPLDSDPTPRTIYLERRPLPQPPLKQALIGLPDGPTICYLRLHYFSSEGTRAVTDAINMAEYWGAEGFIIDLRNNPGGVFEEAIAIANLMLEGGQEIAQTVRTATFVDNTWKAGSLSREVFPTQPGQLTKKPVVILTNSSTASASEVLAGALHGNHRAEIVGEQTFGKGVVQYYFPMTDGSGIKLTIAKYLTPGHFDITQSGGLKPDHACSDFPHGDRVTPENDSCILNALQLIGQKPSQ